MAVLTQLINLKNESERSKAPSLHKLDGRDVTGAGADGRFLLISEEPYRDFLEYLKLFPNHAFVNSYDGGHIYATWGSYVKTKGSETRPYDSMSLLHSGWGSKGMNADLSSSSSSQGAEAWNTVQSLLKELDGIPACGRSAMAGVAEFAVEPLMKMTGLIKRQYFLMLHGSKRLRAVPHEDGRILFFKSVGQTANLNIVRERMKFLFRIDDKGQSLI